MRVAIRLVGAVLVLAAASCAVVVAASSASTTFIYKVNGATLGAGKSMEITAKAKSEFTVTGEETVLGAKVKVITKCKKLKLKPAEHPVIVGGIPGTSEKEDIEFEECTATLGGSKCEGVTIESALANNELVTVVAPSGKAGKPAVLLSPASGRVFATVKFVKCGIFGNHEVKVEGESAALVSHESEERVATTLAWSSGEEITKVRTAGELEESVGLQAGGNPATISGEAEVELVSKEVWGVFKEAFVGQKISAEKVGGVGVGGGALVCAFAAVGQKCVILVENKNPVVGGEEVEIRKQTIVEFVGGVKTQERYFRKVPPAAGGECESPTLLFAGTRLAPAASCNVEIELKEKAVGVEVKGGYSVEARSRPAGLRGGAMVVLTG